MSSYKFPPRQRIGFLMGLSKTQLVVCGVAGAIALFGSQLTGNLVIPFLIGGLLALFGTASWQGVPLRSRVASRLGWVSAQASGKTRHVSAFGFRAGKAAVPECLRTVSIHPVDPVGEWAVGDQIGVVHWGSSSSSVTMPVAGPPMALLDEEAGEQRLRAWGDMLASLCTELSESGIARISWTDVHGAADPRALVRYHEQFGVDGPASAEYREQLGAVATVASDHTVYVTITCTAGSIRRETTLTPDRKETRGSARIDNAVVNQAANVAREMTARGFRVGRPLSPLGVSKLIRKIGDPWAPSNGALTAAERLGMPERGEVFPSAVIAHQRYAAIDGAVHRAYEVVWPSRPVPGDWMWTVLQASTGPKVTTFVFEPMSPSKSQRQVTTELARAGSNATVDARKKGRLSRSHQVQVEALETREAELVAGHGEMACYGVIVLTARDLEDLEQRMAELERGVPRAGGCRIRPWESKHDAGWAAALPIGIRAGEPRD